MIIEVFNFKNDVTKTTFSLATTEYFKKENGEKDSVTQWHNVVSFGGTAKIAGKYLKKGSKVAVEGKLTSRSYDDKEGVKKYVTEVVIHEVLMLDPVNNN